MSIEYQHVYIYMDDSGKISAIEDYAIFAGIVFTNNREKSEFYNKYRQICNEIKCNYCHQNKGSCDLNCDEVKGINIRESDRRRIIELSKKSTTFATVIYNQNLQPDIINRVQSKGRFNEYAQRRLIKKTLIHMISKKVIDPYRACFFACQYWWNAHKNKWLLYVKRRLKRGAFVGNR